MATITYNSKTYNDISGGGVGTNGNDYFEPTSNSMAGGLGDDIYVVNASSGIVTENFGEGTDTVVSSVNYTLGANLENLTLTVAGHTGTGNSGANTFVGTSGPDTFVGLDGNDTYYISNYGDTVVESSNAGSGVDTIISTVSWGLNWGGANVENLTLADGSGATIAVGNDLNNVLTGNSLDNVLNGKGGADVMIGGDGNDRYVVDNAGDVVVETGAPSLHNNNADTILTYVDYAVSDGIENLIFMNSGLTVTGNALDNTYTVVDATDSIVEAANGGTDTVISGVTYTLADNVENLTLTGTAAINGTGNAGNNVLIGNNGNNVLTGGAGDDTYIINSYGDTVVEDIGGGIDTIKSSVSLGLNWYAPNVENLTLTGAAVIGVGNDLNNVITGNGIANILNGKGGDDRLIGGGGGDRLFGDVGNDTFVFNSPMVPGRYGVDQILDFTSGQDHIELSLSVFGGIGDAAGSSLSASEFGLAGSTSGTEHIIYNASTGMLYYDADAGGSASSAVAFANVGTGVSLSGSDFVVAA
jgi:Ca2+-binding RTX toxin-like protein